MKNKKGILTKISKTGSALTRAERIIRAVSRVGFQWPDLDGPLKKVEEELAELKAELRVKKPALARVEAELGDFLFTICNLAYCLELSPEFSLHKMLGRFERRFRFVESCVKKSGQPWAKLSLVELDEFWNQAKKIEKAKSRQKRKVRRT